MSVEKLLEQAAITANEIRAQSINGWGNTVDALASTIRTLQSERDALKLQAQSWASEAKTQKSTVHDCLQAASGATGEKADWNGCWLRKFWLSEFGRFNFAMLERSMPANVREPGIEVFLP